MKIMAVDYGDARTGIAVCDAGEMLASPLGVINQWNVDKLLGEVASLAKEQRVGEIVVGNPLSMDGSEGTRSALCHEFADRLAEASGIAVRMWDERSTTVSATHYLNLTDTRGKKRKQTIDAVAATIILESYLAYRRNHKEE